MQNVPFSGIDSIHLTLVEAFVPLALYTPFSLWVLLPLWDWCNPSKYGLPFHSCSSCDRPGPSFDVLGNHYLTLGAITSHMPETGAVKALEIGTVVVVVLPSLRSVGFLLSLGAIP